MVFQMIVVLKNILLFSYLPVLQHLYPINHLNVRFHYPHAQQLSAHILDMVSSIDTAWSFHQSKIHTKCSRWSYSLTILSIYSNTFFMLS